MRRLLAVVMAGLLGLSAPALAQNTTPILIDQGAPMQSGPVGQASGGEDALAQVPDDNGGGGGGPNPLLMVGLGLGAAGLIIWAVTQNKDDTPVSP